MNYNGHWARAMCFMRSSVPFAPKIIYTCSTSIKKDDANVMQSMQFHLSGLAWAFFPQSLLTSQIQQTRQDSTRNTSWRNVEPRTKKIKIPKENVKEKKRKKKRWRKEESEIVQRHKNMKYCWNSPHEGPQEHNMNICRIRYSFFSLFYISFRVNSFFVLRRGFLFHYMLWKQSISLNDERAAGMWYNLKLHSIWAMLFQKSCKNSETRRAIESEKKSIESSLAFKWT